MKIKYGLNLNRQDSRSGKHYEVHIIDPDTICPRLPENIKNPFPTKRQTVEVLEQDIGAGYPDCKPAINEARRQLPLYRVMYNIPKGEVGEVDGCAYCCPCCDTDADEEERKKRWEKVCEKIRHKEKSGTSDTIGKTLLKKVEEKAISEEVRKVYVREVSKKSKKLK